MWSVTTILVPTDFSDSSKVAMDAAVEVAWKFDASIVLMHAYQVPVYAYPVVPATPVAELTTHFEEAAQNALTQAAEIVQSRGVRVGTVLRIGSPWEEILRVAKDQKAELIVMGTRGLHGLPRALMGSTAERVVRSSPIPVMTLHGPLPQLTPKEVGAKAADELVDQWLI
jgi:nucleotide-binding universal stress UspA family protein